MEPSIAVSTDSDLLASEVGADQLLALHNGVRNANRVSIEMTTHLLEFRGNEVGERPYDADELDCELTKLVSLPDEELKLEENAFQDILSNDEIVGARTPNEDETGTTASPPLNNYFCSSIGGDELEQTLMSIVMSEDDFEVARNDIVSLNDSRTIDPLTSTDNLMASREEEKDDDIDTVSITDGPIPHPSWSSSESLIAQIMSKLSMKEREEVYYDIHGVQDVIDEDAEEGFVDRKLKDMADELLKIHPSDREAYDMAISSHPSYVEHRGFRLRFLRADRFDPKLAAVRYANHYATKLELFGPEKLGRDIVQDDLGREALDALYCGVSQTLPRRDATGRVVWLWIPGSKQQSFSKEALVSIPDLAGAIIVGWQWFSFFTTVASYFAVTPYVLQFDDAVRRR
jgi:hypothetical protein